ncbi:MAG TPA: hypothetical protein VE776_10420 [Actinomycetota bacterium]|nr:hypothetical protein [Actinomycetota bacterium]
MLADGRLGDDELPGDRSVGVPFGDAAVNQVAAADYMGTVLEGGRPAGPSSLLIAGVSLAMLAVAITLRAARHATR